MKNAVAEIHRSQAEIGKPGAVVDAPCANTGRMERGCALLSRAWHRKGHGAQQEADPALESARHQNNLGELPGLFSKEVPVI